MQRRAVLFGGLFLFIGFLCVVGLFQLSQSPDETEKPTANSLEEPDNVKKESSVEKPDNVKKESLPVLETNVPTVDDSIAVSDVLSKISPATLERAKQKGINLNDLLDTSIDVGDVDVSQVLKEWGFESLDEYMAFLKNTPIPTDSDGNPVKLVHRTSDEIEASIKRLESEIEAALLWMRENPQPRGDIGDLGAAQRQQRYQSLSEQLSSYFIFDERGRIVGETDLAKRLREMDHPSSDEINPTPALENPVTPSGDSPQKWSPDTFRTTTRANLSQWGRNINKQYFDVIVFPYLTQEEFDTLYPNPADRQQLRQRQSALQSELVKQARKLLSPNRENRSQEISIIQDLLRADYGNDIADGVIKQLNE